MPIVNQDHNNPRQNVYVHETITRWLNDNYRPTQSHPDALELVATSWGPSHLPTLNYLREHSEPTTDASGLRYPVADGWYVVDHERVACEVVASFFTYTDNDQRRRYETGARRFVFAHEDGRRFEALLVSAWIHDEDIDRDLVSLAAVPDAYLAIFIAFDRICARIDGSARLYKDEVYIVGGTEPSFEAETRWDDIYLPDELKGEILKDVDSFFRKGVEIYKRMNLNPFRKLLLAGVPGTGKTMICSALARRAREEGVFVVYVSGTNQYGARFWKIHEALDVAANSDAPTIVIVEELDAYLEDDSSAEILNVLDGSETPRNPYGTLMIATTNHPEAIDDRVLRRPGRVDRIFIIPEQQDEEAATRLLQRYLGEDWRDEHREVVPDLLGRPGSFIREVALHALTMAAYHEMEGLPVDLLQHSVTTLIDQIEAKEDFLTAHKRRSIGLNPAKKEAKGQEREPYRNGRRR